MTIGSEEFERILRSRGMRVTSQRHHIFEAVNRLKHATPEAILDAISGQLPGMTLSTVYRALEALEEVGLVTHTHLGHSPLTYHAVDDHEHIHLVCESCQHVVSVDSSLAEDLRQRIAREFEFDVDPTHMAIAGRCKTCSESTAGVKP